MRLGTELHGAKCFEAEHFTCERSFQGAIDVAGWASGNCDSPVTQISVKWGERSRIFAVSSVTVKARRAG